MDIQEICVQMEAWSMWRFGQIGTTIANGSTWATRQ